MGYINEVMCNMFGSCRVSASMILKRLINLFLIAILWNFVGVLSIMSVSDTMQIAHSAQNVLMCGFISGSALIAATLIACVVYVLCEICYDATIRDFIENVKDSAHDWVVFKCEKPQK